MDRIQIVKLLLDYNIQIDKQALDILTENEVTLNKLLGIEHSRLPNVITETFLKNLYTNNAKTLKTITRNENISIENIRKIYTKRYEFLKKTLSQNKELHNLISINRITDKTREFSLIGMVSELGNLLKIDDTTGSDIFHSETEQTKFLVEDEVVGIVCKREQDKNIVVKIVHPDIPIKKTTTKSTSDETYLFISGLHMDSPKFNNTYYQNFLKWLEKQNKMNIFVLGEISSRNEDINSFLNDTNKHQISTIGDMRSDYPDPAFLEIENLIFLIAGGDFIAKYKNRWNTSIETTIVNLLKKRHLDPVFTQDNIDDILLLNLIPDIIVLGHANETISTNYKGVSVLTTGNFINNPVYWLLNLKTREPLKIGFS